ncbi:uncharacterized protein ImpL1 [Drosophila tropicalis]|uniref:uncharacterized protein ImpL1 n=1 Tax=Drosophila tropicalis TaxID=46794 RepID=UPI0035AC1871
MKAYQIGLLAVFAACLLLASPSEAKRRKHKGDDHHHHDHHHDKTKTKTKWSTSTDLAGNTQVSTEEHGYYVKRTYAPSSDMSKKRQCPNFLAIPIAWFSPAANANMMPSINSASQSLSEGYLCDDDCVDLYEPICGKTPHEVAVFYNQCKLNVAKCRSHGLWTDFAYEQCQQTYPKETAYADKKFKASPFYRDNATQAAEEQKEQENKDKDQEMDNSSDSSEGKSEPQV